jgi:preprotein translocase subunit SecE
VIRYIQETQAELRKVTWPTREEAIRLTFIVLAFTFIAMVFLGALDILFQRLAGLLL